MVRQVIPYRCHGPRAVRLVLMTNPNHHQQLQRAAPNPIHQGREHIAMALKEHGLPDDYPQTLSLGLVPLTMKGSVTKTSSRFRFSLANSSSASAEATASPSQMSCI
jgi:hypothetical protein